MIKNQSDIIDRRLPEWEEGILDIHHISTGRGDATYFIFPDGTAMLLDAGDVDIENKEKNYFPMKVSPPLPSARLSSARVITDYIKQVSPAFNKATLDCLTSK